MRKKEKLYDYHTKLFPDILCRVCEDWDCFATRGGHPPSQSKCCKYGRESPDIDDFGETIAEIHAEGDAYDDKTGGAGHDRGEEHEGNVAAGLDVISRSRADACMRVPNSPGGLDLFDEIVVDNTEDVHVYCTLCGPSSECSCCK